MLKKYFLILVFCLPFTYACADWDLFNNPEQNEIVNSDPESFLIRCDGSNVKVSDYTQCPGFQPQSLTEPEIIQSDLPPAPYRENRTRLLNDDGVSLEVDSDGQLVEADDPDFLRVGSDPCPMEAFADPAARRQCQANQARQPQQQSSVSSVPRAQFSADTCNQMPTRGAAYNECIRNAAGIRTPTPIQAVSGPIPYSAPSERSPASNSAPSERVHCNHACLMNVDACSAGEMDAGCHR
jgi:hypothetical protein